MKPRNGLGIEFTFLSLHKQQVMVGLRLGRNQYVIQIYKHKLVQHIPQYIIDQVLEDFLGH